MDFRMLKVPQKTAWFYFSSTVHIMLLLKQPRAAQLFQRRMQRLRSHVLREDFMEQNISHGLRHKKTSFAVSFLNTLERFNFHVIVGLRLNRTCLRVLPRFEPSSRRPHEGVLIKRHFAPSPKRKPRRQHEPLPAGRSQGQPSKDADGMKSPTRVLTSKGRLISCRYILECGAASRRSSDGNAFKTGCVIRNRRKPGFLVVTIITIQLLILLETRTVFIELTKCSVYQFLIFPVTHR